VRRHTARVADDLNASKDPVANTRSARKRIRSNETKRVRNKAVRSAVRTKVTKARRAILGSGEAAGVEQEVGAAIKALDRAAEKGILHRNNARRRTSRLAAMAARVQRAAQGAEGETAAVRSAAAGGAKGRSTKAATPRKPAAKPAKAAKPVGKAPAAKATRGAGLKGR
jgi:small subunit ribosomal protein S20